MNKRNITDNKQILTEITRTRRACTELEDFFLKADENIVNDTDDPREGIGRLPGLDRLVFLIPCAINRLEDDLSKSKKIEDIALITEGLQAIKEGFNSALTYYLQEDIEGALSLLNNTLSSVDKLSEMKLQSGIRFLSDVSRIAPDFHILFNVLEGFREVFQCICHLRTHAVQDKYGFRN